MSGTSRMAAFFRGASAYLPAIPTGTSQVTDGHPAGASIVQQSGPPAAWRWFVGAVMPAVDWPIQRHERQRHWVLAFAGMTRLKIRDSGSLRINQRLLRPTSARDSAMTAWPLRCQPAYTCATFRLKRNFHARLLPCDHPRHHRGHHRVPADFLDRAFADRRALAGCAFRFVQRGYPGRRDPGNHAGVLAPHLAIADAMA